MRATEERRGAVLRGRASAAVVYVQSNAKRKTSLSIWSFPDASAFSGSTTLARHLLCIFGSVDGEVVYL